MLECLRFPLRENLIKFSEQKEIVSEMKQSKCKLAFKGRWVYNEDSCKYQKLKEEHEKMYAKIDATKLKLHRAEKMINDY